MFVSEYEIQKRTGLPLELLDRLTKDGYDLFIPFYTTKKSRNSICL